MRGAYDNDAPMRVSAGRSKPIWLSHSGRRTPARGVDDEVGAQSCRLAGVAVAAVQPDAGHPRRRTRGAAR